MGKSKFLSVVESIKEIIQLMFLPRHKSKTLLISEQKKFIFIHNYKVAGTSVRAALSPFQSEFYRYFSNLCWFTQAYLRNKTKWTLAKHCSFPDVKTVFKDHINDFTVFGFVRNPWDWEVSKFEYMRQNTKHFQHELAISFPSFEAYLDWRTTEFRTQTSFFVDPATDQPVGDILKIEDTEEVNQYLTHLTGTKIELPMANTTRRKRYQKYYKTPKSIAVIEDLYKEDIDRFGYSFA